MITLYTTDCPKCKILESKLEDKNITYEKCKDIKTMMAKGYMSAPMLEINDEIMNFIEAVEWVKEQ